MRKIGNIILLVALWTLSSTVYAKDESENVIWLKTTKFTSPLIEHWISEYTKIDPQMNIKIADKDVKPEDISLEVQAVWEEAVPGTQAVVYIGRYALLPVTTRENPHLDYLTKKKWGKKELKKLFFIEEFPESESTSKKQKPEEDLTVYSVNNKASGSVVFASHFGNTPSEIKGTKISGDDIFLLTALKKDPSGIIVNHLTYLYDIESRHLKEELALLPLDVKKGQQEILLSADIDKTLKLLEEEKIDLIPVEYIGLIVKEELQSRLQGFLQWITTDGQTFNHNFGLLQLDSRTIADQGRRLNKTLLSNR